MSGKNIGIDLGTTQSSVAVYHIKPVALKNKEGQDLTPSCVSFVKGKPDHFLVGQTALDWMQQDPAHTVRSVKRLMGRSFDDPFVQKMVQENRVTYKIQPSLEGSEKNIVIILNGKEFLPEDICAEILKKLKTDTEASLSSEVAAAVVTVPAFFNDKQKNATRVACNKAHLPLLRLLPEPTAAALSFGLDMSQEAEGKQVLVFDFGGGTLDLCLLAIAGNQFLEVGKGGDSWLGGDDIDQALIDYIFSVTEENDGLQPGTIQKWIDALSDAEKSRWSYEIKRKAEAAKIALSTKKMVTVDVLGLLKNDKGRLVNIEADVTREAFEKILEPLITRAMKVTKDLLEELHFEKNDVTHVLLVGGSSQIPCIQRSLKEYFSEEQILCHERPLLAIAEGAAILGHQLSLTEVEKEKENFGIIHTVSHDYFIELKDGKNSLLVSRNTPLPFRVRKAFELVDKNQSLVHLKVFNPVHEEHQLVGNVWFSFDHEALQHHFKPKNSEDKNPLLVVDFSIDESNLIHVSAFLKGFANLKVSKTLSRGYEDEKLFLDLETMVTNANQEGVPYYTAIDVLHRAAHLVHQMNKIIDFNSHQVNKELLSQTSKGLDVMRQIIEEKTSVYPKLFFIETMLLKGHEEFFSSKENYKKLQYALKEIQEKVLTSTYEELMDLTEDLDDLIDQEPVVAMLVRVESGISEVDPRDTDKLERLNQQLALAMNALRHGAADNAMYLFKEMLSDLENVYQGLITKKFDIHTAIQQESVS